MVFVIAAFAIALLATRPFGLPRWVWPVAAALLIVALGYEPVPSAVRAILAQWNVLLFIAGLLGISAAAHAAGVFHWITDFVLARAGGSWRALFIGLFLTGAVIALLLSNDATAVVLTPIVYRAVTRHGGNPKPFLFA
ncbi:MAG: anion permease, partial [Candidatus Eremiobacteraeota bacterium]|nr:anion permease [Candidatus Eremiobacteraeota bacterium]